MPLLTRVSPIHLFLHDSAHTVRNLLFELEHAWDALAPGGVAEARGAFAFVRMGDALRDALDRGGVNVAV